MKIGSPPQSTHIDLVRYLRQLAQQVNAIAEGNLYAHHGALSAAPVSGSWAQGDVVKNTEPVESGLIGSKYVVTGWICVASGAPGTWVATRSLTGN